jgi:hypothetical protein
MYLLLNPLVCVLGAHAGSWDAVGVHFATSGNGGSWADSQLQALVKSHNAAVR